jgi:hypothetical protein
LWVDIIWLSIRSSYGEYVHEYVGFINSGEFTDQVREYFLKKGKAIPLQALTGPEGSRRLRLPEFKTIGT